MHAQVYALLAVNARQLSPSTVSLRVSEEGDFGVSQLRLQKTKSQGQHASPDNNWFPTAHEGLVLDAHMLEKSPIYTNNCSRETGCANRHWMCPFMLSSLFGGSVRAQLKHTNVQLITPGNPHPGVASLCIPYGL